MFNILLCDDEIEIVEIIKTYLLNERYNVFTANDGMQCLEILKNNNIHLVILDIMMPEINGLQVCRKIREKLNIPIIIMSAKGTDADKIQGLAIGADDYIVKPFNPMELVARVKSQIRRYVYLNQEKLSIKDEDSNDIIKIKGITINKKNHKVLLYGKELQLTPIEYKILLLLASNKGKVFNSEEIFSEVWKEKYFNSNNTVMVHMWRLRVKIEEDPKNPKIIETVWGVGYKIEE